MSNTKQTNECPCFYKVNNILQLGPVRQRNACPCSPQGFDTNGNVRKGYCKNIPLPYVNYSTNLQRSPYDNNPWNYRQYAIQDINHPFDRFSNAKC